VCICVLTYLREGEKDTLKILDIFSYTSSGKVEPYLMYSTADILYFTLFSIKDFFVSLLTRASENLDI
jgi:hypothetical protein